MNLFVNNKALLVLVQRTISDIMVLLYPLPVDRYEIYQFENNG